MALDPAELPPRRRDSWSIRKIAEEIGGRPIADFQGDAPPASIAPYRPAATASLPRRPAPVGGATAARSPSGPAEPPAEEELDPVARVYPPLTRGTGRALHGVEKEHHAETLATVRPDPGELEPGRAPHRPGPSTRPERVYLHYLLLHLDRLSDHALTYLHRAVTEELEARKPPAAQSP